MGIGFSLSPEVLHSLPLLLLKPLYHLDLIIHTDQELRVYLRIYQQIEATEKRVGLKYRGDPLLMLPDESYRAMIILPKMGCSAIDADLS